VADLDAPPEEAPLARPKRRGTSTHPAETAPVPITGPGGRGRGGRRRSAYATRDLTEGSIPRNLWFLSWPQVVESLLNTADQLMDLVWAGRLGARSIAGLGVAQTYVQIGMTGRQGLDMAMRAMVARAVGAGDVARANHIALQAFSLSGAFSIIMAAIGVFLTEPLLLALGVPDSVVLAGADYMRAQFVGSGTNAFRMMSGAALQASGDTMTPMRASMVARALHVVLSPMFIFGWLFFPELGLMGAAIANVIAQGVGATLNFRALFLGTSRLKLTLKGYSPDFPLLWSLLKIGAPASVTQAERQVAQLLLIAIVSPYGATTLAVFALTRRLENFVMMGARGLGQGAGVLVGQNLGAGKPRRARQTVAWAILFVFVINALMAGSIALFPQPLVSLFDPQGEMADIAAKWVRIAAIGFLFLGIGQVFQQSYNTAGDTLVPMIVTLVSIWGVQQPLALTLPGLGLGEYGIAWAVVIAVLVRLLFYSGYFFTERWLRVRF
jgi:putative MATE family efflux protein